MMVYNPAGANSVLNQGEANKGLVTLIQGKPLLDILAMYLDYTIDRGFNILGYNSPQGTREHGTNKTTAEVSVNMQNDLLTTQLKRGIRTKQINRLIKKTGKVLGIDDIDCRIEIHGMSTMEISKYTDNITLRLQSGSITRAEAISRLDRIPLEEAEEMAKKIEAEEKKRAEFQTNNKDGGFKSRDLQNQGRRNKN